MSTQEPEAETAFTQSGRADDRPALFAGSSASLAMDLFFTRRWYALMSNQACQAVKLLQPTPATRLDISIQLSLLPIDCRQGAVHPFDNGPHEVKNEFWVLIDQRINV